MGSNYLLVHISLVTAAIRLRSLRQGKVTRAVVSSGKENVWNFPHVEQPNKINPTFSATCRTNASLAHWVERGFPRARRKDSVGEGRGGPGVVERTRQEGRDVAGRRTESERKKDRNPDDENQEKDTPRG
ncbi:hypothetical protein KM043_014613 [Ampulex compressa]|nr:hypothetical protein KM043_014613 [Ampulex compressa]